MAGTATINHNKNGILSPENYIHRYDIAWTSDASGNVNAQPAFGINGKILALITDPVDGPTDDYDVTILNEFGLDVLQGLGVNRDTTTTEIANIVVSGTTIHPPAAGPHTLVVANAGNAKSGTMCLLVESK